MRDCDGLVIGMILFAGIVCDRGDDLCRYLRIDGKVFKLTED